MIITLIAVAALSQFPGDAKVTNLGDGYSRVQTPSYVIEVPTGWDVSEETSWGQRNASPKGAEGELGVMTAPPGRQTWDQLYQTSLYFILRESNGTPTPYRLGRTASGLETASFEVLDASGFAARRFLLVRGNDGRLLALSVRVPSQTANKEWSKHFERMSSTARFLPESK
ncbi:MAG: hypothetical protein AB7F50_11490 [Fimbriimonadaceae bacterium]